MTEFNDFVEFLRVQIRVDQVVAQDALDDWVEGEDGDEMAGQPDSILVGAHLVRWSPLTEAWDYKGPWIRALKMLGLPFADRGGYREQWRP